jgi:hypothetical protein
MKHLKTYKVFESEFFDSDYIDTLLDKISDSGMESLSDIEKNQLNLFSEDDKEIIETIEKMGDITREFKDLNKKMREISDSGGDPFYLMKDWMELNDQLRPLEQSFRKWGIELGDPRLDRLMRKTRPDAYNNIFESTEIYGQKEGFSNQYILDDVEDILLELEDIGIECRMWTNDYKNDISHKKTVDRLSRIVLEINYDTVDFIKRYEFSKVVDDVRSRLESYFKENGGRVRVTYESNDFLELNINIFR